MSSEGTITADIIKNAMFKAADDIEGRYAKMPKTIGDYWTLMKNKAIQAFTPVIEKISELINTPEFQEFFENLCIGIQLAAEAVNFLVEGFVWLCDVMEPFCTNYMGNNRSINCIQSLYYVSSSRTGNIKCSNDG